MPYRNRLAAARGAQASTYAVGALLLNLLYERGKITYRDYMRVSKKPDRVQHKYAKQVERRLKKGRHPFKRKGGLKYQVKELRRLAEAGMGHHIEKQRNSGSIAAAVHASKFTSHTGVTVTILEGILANLRFFNPSVPGTLTTAAGGTGTYQRDYYFHSVFSTYMARNNYQIPCKVTVYCFVPKSDTNITPATAYTNGLTDIGAPTATSALMYPTDSIQLNDLWKIAVSKSVILEPGESCKIVYKAKKFQFDPSFVDSHSLSYQSRYGCHTFGARVEGILGHDTVETDEFTTLAGQIDIQLDHRYEVSYDAGIDVTTVIVDDSSSATFTTGGVVSNKPVSDNQALSLA